MKYPPAPAWVLPACIVLFCLALVLPLALGPPKQGVVADDYGPKFHNFCPKAGFTPQQCWFLACSTGHGGEIGYDCERLP